MLITNNTGVVYGKAIGGLIRGGDRFWNLERVEIYNNLVTGSITQMDKQDSRVPESFRQSHNLAKIDPAEYFVDPDGADFRLADGAKAIDAGKTVPPYTDGFVGDAPDIGALEHGGEDWTKTVGADRQIVNAPTGLSGKANADGTIDLTWTDNADNELGYVVEVGYRVGYWCKAYEFITIGRTEPDATSFHGLVPLPMQTVFVRVRTDRSYYSNTITLNAGQAKKTITFDSARGYEPGPIDSQDNWDIVEGGRGRVDGLPKGEKGLVLFETPWAQVVKHGEDDQVLAITGREHKMSIAYLGNIHTLLEGFDPDKSTVKVSLRIAQKATSDSDKNAVQIKIGNLGYWQGPGGGVGDIVLSKDGQLKWGWRTFATLSDYAKPGEFAEVSMHIDFSSNKVENITVGGKAIDATFDTKFSPTSFAHALWQIQSDVDDADHAVMLDDLSIELVE
jgi:hypothetical protein